MTSSIGSGLLAMAVTTSLALANGGGDEEKKKDQLLQGSTPGWSYKPGTGLMYDGGDAFGLTLGNQLQVKYTYASIENIGAITVDPTDPGISDNVNNFDVRRARTTFTGHAFDRNIIYLVRMDHTDDGTGSNGSLKDGWVQWNFMSDESGRIGLRVGQSKTYHGLESTGSSSGLDFVERSFATQIFSDERSRGAWLHGSHAENKIRWTFGAQNGDVSKDFDSVANALLGGAATVALGGEEADNDDNELTYVGSVSFDPMGDTLGGKQNESFRQANLDGAAETRGTIGAGVMLGNGSLTAGGARLADIESTAININTAWKLSQIALQGEVFLRKDEVDGTGIEADSVGWYAQGSYTMPKSGDSEMQWGLAARVSQVSTEFDDGAGTIVEPEQFDVTIGVNAFYRGHAAKTQINYTFRQVDDVPVGVGTLNSDNGLIEIMFQLLF